MRRLRIAKRRVALARRGRRARRRLVARTADGGAQPVCRGGDRRGGAPSAARRRRKRRAGARPIPTDPERDSGFIVLGMGKLGGGELNYSSDIDLILLYDPARSPLRTRDGAQIVLHPAGPRSGAHSRRAHRRWLCVSHRSAAAPRPALDAAGDVGRRRRSTYYETVGQNWERAALIKARPVAGDRAAGAAVSRASCNPLSGARTSISRRSRTSTRSSARSRRISGGGRIAVEGHDIKIGRGGIREIEFFAQTQQLIWGGRLRELRVAPTCDGAAPPRRRRPDRPGDGRAR